MDLPLILLVPTNAPYYEVIVESRKMRHLFVLLMRRKVGMTLASY